jgi:hypothetical protein
MQICQLNEPDATKLERNGIAPACHFHNHLPEKYAQHLVDRRQARFVGPKQRALTLTRVTTDRGYDLAAGLKEAKRLHPVQGSMQLVNGERGGDQGRLRYPIPMHGARKRTMRVAEINKPC